MVGPRYHAPPSCLRKPLPTPWRGTAHSQSCILFNMSVLQHSTSKSWCLLSICRPHLTSPPVCHTQDTRESLKHSLDKRALKIHSVPVFVLSSEDTEIDGVRALYQGIRVMRTLRHRLKHPTVQRQSSDSVIHQLCDPSQVTLNLQSPISSSHTGENWHLLLGWLFV